MMSFQKLIYLIFLFILVGCKNKIQNQKILIVSQDKKHAFRDWISQVDAKIRIVDFYNLPKDSMQYYLLNSDGIIMSGGEDINPSLYNHSDYKEICGEMDNYRDSLEILLLKHAMKSDKPLLAICRGHQLMNVINGGSLIPDIPTFIKDTTIHHRTKKGIHPITCVKNSWIDKNFTSNDFMVNSRHHQCIDRIAKNFKVAAKSPDGVIESIELKDPSDHRFIIGVQFHPENMNDSLSRYLRKIFLSQLYLE